MIIECKKPLTHLSSELWNGFEWEGCLGVASNEADVVEILNVLIIQTSPALQTQLQPHPLTDTQIGTWHTQSTSLPCFPPRVRLLGTLSLSVRCDSDEQHVSRLLL